MGAATVNYLIFVLGLSALSLLYGCTTTPEAKPQPAPEPQAQAVIKPPEAIPQPAVPQPTVKAQRPADTGVEWVTDISDLKSRHRFQLAGHTIEVSGATRYHGGSATDIDVGARLRAVGVYRDRIVVASAIYIEQPAPPAPIKPAAMTKAPGKMASPAKPRTARSSARTPDAPAASTSSADTGALEKAAAKPILSESTVAATAETAALDTPSANPNPVSTTKEPAHTTEPPRVSPALAKPSSQPPAAKMPPAQTAEPPAPSSAETGVTAAKDFSQPVFDRRTLPMTLGHGWTLDHQRDVVDGATRCVLLSPAFTIPDGYDSAKARLHINPVRAWVKADSNIDTSYPEQGLRVDGGKLVPFATNLANEQTAYTDVSMLPGMAAGHTLTVALGFWPTWPQTKTQTASIDLAGFANVYAALQACSQQQQAAAK